MFTRILVPVDGSKHALRAVEYAADIAERYKAQVNAITVTDYNQLHTSSLPPQVKTNRHEAMRAQDAVALVRAEALLVARGVTTVTQELEGPPAFVIEHTVQEGDYERIIVGVQSIGITSERRVSSEP